MARDRLMLGLVAVIVAATGCGTDDERTASPPAASAALPAQGATRAAEPAGSPAARHEPTAARLPARAASPRVIAAGVSGVTAKRPKLGVKPTGKPPRRLRAFEVTASPEPAAQQAQEGDLVAVRYTATSWSDGEEFDASWNVGRLFPFVVGSPQVIPGLSAAVTGMRVGERKLVVIPPELGYRALSVPGMADRDETLVFVVDLVEVRRGTSTYRLQVPTRGPLGSEMDPDRTHTGGSSHGKAEG